MTKEKEYRSAQELRREIADLKIQLAFQEKFEEEVECILAECEQTHPDTLAAVRDAEKDLLEEISQHYRKNNLQKIRRMLKTTTGRIVAMATIGLLISISSAMAAIQMVRAGVFELDVVGDNRRISVKMVRADMPDVPDVWKGKYYPTYIPEGFEFVPSYFDEYGVMYFHEDERWISFSENYHGIGTSVDTENATISSTWINGIEAMLIEKGDVATVVWTFNERYFVVKCMGRKEMAVQIAASVIEIGACVK